MTEHELHSAAVGSPVIIREAITASGLKVGFARLNAEKALNALSLDMIRRLDAQLQTWAKDDAVTCVVLEGAGEKAFCAGGDVRALYYAIQKHPGDVVNPQAMAFFSEEYRLDYRIRRYSKPVLVWGGGIVMGGGLGLLAGASHRVVTDTSRIAMPEISIGLFPDVGGSWFLRRMPGSTGLLVALTAVPLNGRDALHAGLADHLLSSGQRQAVFDRVLTASWRAHPGHDRAVLTELLGEFPSARSSAPASNLELHADKIDRACEGDSLPQVIQGIENCAGDDAWLKRGVATLKAGSPTTAALIWELRRRTRDMTLSDVFRLELIVALQCCAHPDFAEGVRAVLIDKDHAPRWTPATLAEVTPNWIAEHFAAPAWPRHPLLDL
jgi:enoyl-CoA hydratase/carnithine racemase